MERSISRILLTLLMSLSVISVSAHDVASVNADGVTIYYNWINDNTELEVTSWIDKYSGDVVIPESVTYQDNTYSVTSIGVSAFMNCHDLRSVTIPNTVTSIGNNAFHTSGLTSVSIGNSIVSIGEKAFYQCTSLTSLTIPNSVTSIGDNAFYLCSKITSLTIPSSVTTIGYRAFYCISLTSIKVETGNATYDSRNNCNAIIETASNTLISGCKNTIIPNDVTSIGDYAFNWNNDYSVIITIPNSVTSIGEKAFNCSLDAVVSLIESPFNINTNTFYDVTYSKKELIVPQGTKSAYQSKKGWSSFQTISEIGTHGSCGENLTWTYDEARRLLTISGSGNMDNYSEDTAPWYGFRKMIQSVIIEPEVASIGQYAFNECNHIERVSIPYTITSIGGAAFNKCSGLKEVHVSDLAAWCKIAFSNSLSNPFCYSHCLYLNGEMITDLVIPSSVTSISNFAFYDCSGLTSVTIPNSVTSIGDYTFCKCKGLTSVNLGTGLTSIGRTAFSECIGLTSVTIPNGVSTIGLGAFSSCSSLTSVIIPGGLTSMGDGAFSNCKALTSFQVLVTDYSAFCNNKVVGLIKNYVSEIHLIDNEGNEIKEYDIPNTATSIGNNAFAKCTGLTAVNLPNSITSIGYSAFENCSNLASINIANGVTKIGSHSFDLCSSLNSLTIPNTVTSIGYGVFVGCEGLTSIVVEDGNTVYDSRENCNAIIKTANNELILGCRSTSIPNSVISIGLSAFEFNSCPSSLDIPNSVTSIGNRAFSCSKGLTSVTIGNGVTSIGEGAFSSCSSLKSVTLGSSVTSIGTQAFFYCSAVTEMVSNAETPPVCSSQVFEGIKKNVCKLYVPESSVETYQAAESWADFENILPIPTISPNIVFSDANVKAICVDNWDADGDGELSEKEAANVTDLGDVFKNNVDITSFDELQYFKGLTIIGEKEFYNCTGLTSITFPINITTIENYAFAGCSSLTQISIPSGVNTIGSSVFSNCTNIASIKVESGNPYYTSSISSNAIIDSKSNTLKVGCKKTVIPSIVTSISSDAFEGCSGLTSITIPASVISIDKNPFIGCTGLTTIKVADGNTMYDSRNSCNAIIKSETNSIVTGCINTIIPSDVTKIGNYAFSGLNNLTSIEIPKSVTAIGDYAFEGCTGVVEIECRALTPPVCGSYVFHDINKSECKLYVPEGSMAAYHTSNQWEEFTYIEERESLGGKCAMPTISYQNDKLKFECETTGVTFHYRVTSSASEGEGAEVSLPASYTVTVYATKEGYDDSDIATEVIDGRGLKGDVNNDGVVTVADAVTVMDIILEGNE